MILVENFRAEYKKTLDTVVGTYKRCQKEIDQLKKMAYYDKPFPIRRVAAKYNVPYTKLRGRICVARERDETN